MPKPHLSRPPHADLFMNAPGSGDQIPFTTSGLDFHCGTCTVSIRILMKLKSRVFGAFMRTSAAALLQRATVAFMPVTLVFCGIF